MSGDFWTITKWKIKPEPILEIFLNNSEVKSGVSRSSCIQMDKELKSMEDIEGIEANNVLKKGSENEIGNFK